MFKDSRYLKRIGLSTALTRLGLLATLCVLTAGCDAKLGNSDSMQSSERSADTDGYVVQLNPSAKQAYQLRATLQDVPSTLSSISAIAQYDVINPVECGKYHALAGTHLSMTSDQPVELSKLSASEYGGDFYLDRLLDQDYFGRGVCHWALSEVRLLIHGPAPEDSVAVAGLPVKMIQAGQARSRYFWKGHYPQDEIAQFVDIGRADLESVPQHGRKEFFAIGLSASQIKP